MDFAKTMQNPSAALTCTFLPCKKAAVGGFREAKLRARKNWFVGY